jgi:hypothetical protein
MRPIAAFAFLLTACSGGDTDTDVGPVAVCTTPTAIQCEDQIILDLSLHDDLISDGDVETTTDGADFVTTVDASAGGMNEASDNPWVYVKFTDTGAVRVDLADEPALESMDWDIAARRFGLRLNGGVSGPSCVGAAVFLESTYDELTTVPAGIEYVQEAFYTDSCTYVPDSFGLNSPQVVLSPWWSYESCVETTGHPALIRLADGRVIKFVVEAYYGTGQDDCNSDGTPGGDSANFTWRWAFVD